MEPDNDDTAGLHAQASDDARINQVRGNQYIKYIEHHEHHEHYEDGVRRAKPPAGAELCPYPTDMAAFRAEDAEWFFGRDRLTAQLVERVDHRVRDGGSPLVVVAPSGVGKSSLLQAGLIPKLEQGALTGSQHWPRLLLTPTATPVMALATQIAALTDDAPAELATQITQDPDHCVDGLRALLQDRTRQASIGGARLVVIVDQLEELFTMCGDHQQRHLFLDLISRLTSNGPGGHEPVAVALFGLRSDFYTHCTDYSQLRPALQDGQVVLGPMSPDELRAAILNPAQRAGLRVEPGLVDVLMRDLGATMGTATTTDAAAGGYEAGRLPLLAHALRATWLERHGHTLTVSGYQVTGGIQHAVATTAERAFTKLGSAQQRTAQTLFLRLVKIGDGTEDTRQRVPRTELLGNDADHRTALTTVVDAFTRERLLTQDHDSVEITHEALLRAWPRLREWINQDRSGNLVRQQLHDNAAEWDRDGRDTGALYRGIRLQLARDWKASQPQNDDLTLLATDFLDASIQQEQRDARRRRGTLIAISLLTVVALIGGFAIWRLKSTSDDADFNQLISQADQLFGYTIVTDQSQAAQKYLVAHRIRPNDWNVNTQLINTEYVPLSISLQGHTDTVNTLAFRPDRKTLATGTNDGTVRLWDITKPTQPPLAQFRPKNQFVPDKQFSINSVAFSPDGNTLADVDGGGGVELWDTTNPSQPMPLPQPSPDTMATMAAAFSVAFSPDGKTLAVGSGDGTEQLWDVTKPAQPRTLPPLHLHKEYVYSVAFSPDSKILADGSTDDTVRLWNVANPAQPKPLGQPLTGHTDDVRSVAFSRDGTTLASVAIQLV